MCDWQGHLQYLLATLGVLLLVAVLLIAVANPYGNLPISLLGRHVIMDDNQRFQYPAIIRSGRYDSLVIGTSTSRLLAPRELNSRFGGRFANLALNSGKAWEQWQIARLFQRVVGNRDTILIGLDQVWCDADADRNRITVRGFPNWMYDANPWNDILYMLNTRALEISGRRVGNSLGLVKARWPDDGYEVFVPPESTYDLVRAQFHIWGRAGPRAIEPQLPFYSASEIERARWRYPALDWLADLLADAPSWGRFVLMFMPVHVAAQPRPGTEAAARETECKRRVAYLAATHSVPLVDFRIASAITTRDANYWDPLHFRVPIATRIVEGLARALALQRDDAAGEYRFGNGVGVSRENAAGNGG